MKKCALGLEPDACCGHKLRLAPLEVNTRVHPLRFQSVSQPIGVRLIEGRQRAEDLRRLAAGEVTPEELRRENSIVQSGADILAVDFSFKGTPDEWERIIQDLERE